VRGSEGKIWTAERLRLGLGTYDSIFLEIKNGGVWGFEVTCRLQVYRKLRGGAPAVGVGGRDGRGAKTAREPL